MEMMEPHVVTNDPVVYLKICINSRFFQTSVFRSSVNQKDMSLALPHSTDFDLSSAQYSMLSLTFDRGSDRNASRVGIESDLSDLIACTWTMKMREYRVESL